MKVTITTRHYEATNEFKSYIEDSLDDTERYLDKIQSASVILNTEKYRQKAEIIIDSSAKNFVCEDVTDDMRRSFDNCLDKLKTQLRRYKEKLKNHKVDRLQPLPETVSDEDAEDY